ncbi:MAG: DUF805 domain-containing protein [Tannerella sp.]|jgi:uncharacterized membrane protein YhaH (DUF805 family)|nr:DUF805 domain-containing protein [Tannerella sp.]
MEWYLKVLRQYADFEGRARRAEYWMFVLFNFIISFVVSIIVVAITLIARNGSAVFLSYLYVFATMIPSLAVMVRRLHDTGRSAWYLLISFIPVVGSIWLFIILLTEGKPGKNRYGDNPKESGFRTDFNRNKSVAVTLIISSFVWIFHLLASTVLNWNMYGWNVSLFLSFFTPVGLAVTGFLLLYEKKFTNHVAYALIVTSVVWFMSGFNMYGWGDRIFYLITGNLVLITPAALMVLAVSALEKKDSGIIVPVLLIVGFCMSLVTLVFGPHRLNDAVDFLRLIIDAVSIMAPIGFLVLAIHLLHKKTKRLTGKNGLVKSGNVGYVQTPQAVAPQNNVKNASPNNGGKVYYERDNKGMRIETVDQSMIYWMVERVKSPRKDPFVYYTFKREYDARAALLELPFIHAAADTRKLICDELFRYGYFAVTNDGQLTGEYDAFISGADFTYDMWEQAHVAFARHNGVKKNDLEPERKTSLAASNQPVAGNAGNVTFVREDKDSTAVWVVYKAPCKADAIAFLSRQQIVRSLYYVVVETPDGNFGRDKDGFYQE